MTALVFGAAVNARFNEQVRDPPARHHGEMAEEAKQGTREEAERKVIAHEEALKREREHQRELEEAWGGPAEAAWKNPDLSIAQMLEQLARACAPPASPVTVRVDRFTEFELNLGVDRGAGTTQLAEISQCLMRHAAPYLRELRFIQNGRIQVDLDAGAVDSVPDWKQASVVEIGRLIASVEDGGSAGKTDASPADQNDLVAKLEAKMKEVNPTNDEPPLSGDSQHLREANLAFNRMAQEKNARLNAAIEKQGQAGMLGDVHTTLDLERKSALLHESEAALGEAREFYLNQDRVYRQLLEQEHIDLLLANISVRGVSERLGRRRPYLEQLFQALDERQRSATALLTDMKSMWGSWSGDATETRIQFTSVAVRDAYEQASVQFKQASKQVATAMHAWSGWEASQK